ncbi:MAG: nucleoside-diphosphate kinase [Planctomycetota bacterium]|nr:nucleoside-diphosphate kinase [Planctomycetota bacterium]
MERTLVMLKPDAVQRGFVGRILARFEAKGLKLVALKLARVDRALAERHYAPHKGKDFYEPLLAFVTSGPMVFVVLEGKGAVAVVRKMMGATFGPSAEPGTLRGDFGMSNRFNLVHGSDAPEAAEREIAIFFRPEELIDWQPAAQPWVYDFSTGDVI